MTNATIAFAKSAPATLPKMECLVRHVRTRNGHVGHNQRKQDDWSFLRIVTNERRLGVHNRTRLVVCASREIRDATLLAQPAHLVKVAKTITYDVTGT